VQVTQHQQLGAGAQGHERDQFALVHEDGQRPLGRDVDDPPVPVFVQDLDFSQ
jgi:hypothetical protein